MKGKRYTTTAIVPGCVRLDLLGNRQIPNPFWGTNKLEVRWIEEPSSEYRGTFDVLPVLLAENVVELTARCRLIGTLHPRCLPDKLMPNGTAGSRWQAPRITVNRLVQKSTVMARVADGILGSKLRPQSYFDFSVG
jgi:hypothetical protein